MSKQVEDDHHFPSLVYIKCKDGAVTVDINLRIFCVGYGQPRSWRGERFSGREWLPRLCDAAVRHLESIVGERPALAKPGVQS